MNPEYICVQKCPRCESAFRVDPHPMISFEDSMMWTDGKVIGPHYVARKFVICCPTCQAPCLVEKSETIAEFDEYPEEGHGIDDSEFSNILEARIATIHDYLILLREWHLSGEEELYVRVELMHLWNDRRRDGFGPEMTEAEIANLKSITALIKPKGLDDILLLGEAYRELGCFDTSDRVLALIEPATNQWAMFLRYLASRKDASVQEFHNVPESFAKMVSCSIKMSGLN